MHLLRERRAFFFGQSAPGSELLRFGTAPKVVGQTSHLNDVHHFGSLIKKQHPGPSQPREKSTAQMVETSKPAGWRSGKGGGSAEFLFCGSAESAEEESKRRPKANPAARLFRGALFWVYKGNHRETKGKSPMFVFFAPILRQTHMWL